MYVVNVPISVPVSRAKRFYLNLNQYRNAHHFTLSKAKTNFHELVSPLLKNLPQFETVNLIFTLFPGSEQLVDTSNVCSIVDKFFSDVLVSCKRIQDDNRKIVLSALYRYGEVDRTNPRCEVTIIPGDVCPGSTAVTAVCAPSTKKERPMQITIVQVEIEQAIRDYIQKQINVREDHRIDIDLRATRGAEGYQAMIDIVPIDSPEAAADAAASTSTTTGVREVASEVRSSRAAGAATAPTPAPAQPVAKANRPTSVAKQEAAASESTPVAEPEVQSASEGAPETATAAADAATEVATAEAPRKSLFGDLKKPENP